MGALPGLVLIVDDAALFRDVARELLERRGYAVVGEAATAAAAMEMVEQLRPDAALVDTRLPDGDGFALTAALVDARPGLAVLLTSAAGVPADLAGVRASGARGFVHKSRLARADLAQFWPRP